jgi:hypothetical protein
MTWREMVVRGRGGRWKEAAWPGEWWWFFLFFDAVSC